MSLPPRGKKKVKGGALTRMKTTLSVKNAAAEKDMEGPAMAILDLSQSFTKEMFPFQRFFGNELADMTESLDQVLSAVRCDCKELIVLDHCFRLRPDGASKTHATEDLSPPEYLKQLNLQRRNVIVGGAYNETAYKVVKRYGNIIAHILDAHLEHIDVGQMEVLWNQALVLLHFRKAFVPKEMATTPASKTLATAMAICNQVRGENGLKLLRNHINPGLIVKG